MYVTGKQYAKFFMLSEVMQQIEARMNKKGFKKNIMHCIHILGCMQIRKYNPESNLAKQPNYLDPFGFSPVPLSQENSAETKLDDKAAVHT